MTDYVNRISELIIKKLNSELNEVEESELETWMNQSEKNRIIAEQFLNEEKLQAGIRDIYMMEERIWGRLEEEIPSNVQARAILKNKEEVSVRRHSNVLRMTWTKVAAAASVIFILGIGSYFMFFNKTDKPIQLAKTQQERFKNDVEPGKYKAKLTLADGSTIVLDSAALGELAKQGGTVVLNKDGQLVYQAENMTGKVMYNTLSTARGESYVTVLSDGSKVWLNSASSIKFPVAFVGNERRVEITGEAYFEVAKDVTKPFKVSANAMEVQVLGTHFNINAYNDEQLIKTTLLEGSVKVSQGNANNILKPGQQAQVNNGNIKVITADVDEAIAWKNGVFQCDNTDVESVMKQISRWYDVDVVYEKPVTKRVSLLNVPRTLTITNILKIMEMTGNVKFVIEGKKVTVMP